MPRALPEALLEGLAWDAVGRRYDTLSGVLRLFRPRGHCGGRDDVRADAGARGRCAGPGLRPGAGDAADQHRPRRGRGCPRRAAVPAARLAGGRRAWTPRTSWRDPSLLRAIRRMVRAAAGRGGRPLSPGKGRGGRPARRCRPGIFAARLIYAGIGTAVARRATTASRAAPVPARAKDGLAEAGGRADGGDRSPCPPRAPACKHPRPKSPFWSRPPHARPPRRAGRRADVGTGPARGAGPVAGVTGLERALADGVLPRLYDGASRRRRNDGSAFCSAPIWPACAAPAATGALFSPGDWYKSLAKPAGPRLTGSFPVAWTDALPVHVAGGHARCSLG